MKKLLLVHGDKGGVGKSTLASALIDLALAGGPICVVEGDIKVADVARRFSGIPDVLGLVIDLARPDGSEDAIIGLFEKIEAAGAPEMIVVNLPAGASSTIDAQAQILHAASREIGYEIRVAWMIGAGADSARLAGESAICRVADKKIAVFNAALGEIAKSVWMNHPARDAWLSSGGLETIMPALASRVMTEVRDRPGRYTDLIAPTSGLSVISRQIIKNWMSAIAAGPGGLMFHDGDEK
ncbi:hypothetical protein [Acidiphilium acidophilum]|uniref:CobQ/CobB/MinD/ParA nucleotide binding domain-containing protein n=1 Tax=Acidiphilium acidophilum TaxID=76588 RepID=A0AAW9DSQ9_ACIAO|nr:hypothetical protein [Acidiphilium acidophilum]MDX5931755.1 hypothetical protein [Acidiphilium acidophilum]